MTYAMYDRRVQRNECCNLCKSFCLLLFLPLSLWKLVSTYICSINRFVTSYCLNILRPFCQVFWIIRLKSISLVYIYVKHIIFRDYLRVWRQDLSESSVTNVKWIYTNRFDLDCFFRFVQFYVDPVLIQFSSSVPVQTQMELFSP